MTPNDEERSRAWTEAEYVSYLAAERHLFAWCLVRYGGVSDADAQLKALARYPYEPPGDELRGLIFHDESWHWAMLHLHGEQYWLSKPHLERPSPEYEHEARKRFTEIAAQHGVAPDGAPRRR